MPVIVTPYYVPYDDSFLEKRHRHLELAAAHTMQGRSAERPYDTP